MDSLIINKEKIPLNDNLANSLFQYQTKKHNTKVIQDHLNKGFLYLEQQRFYDSIKLFDKVIELNDEDTLAYNLKGYSFQKVKKYREAMDIYEKSMKLDQYNPFTYVLISSCYFKQNKYNKAKEFLDKALEIDSSNKYALLLKLNIEKKMKKLSLLYSDSSSSSSDLYTEKLLNSTDELKKYKKEKCIIF